MQGHEGSLRRLEDAPNRRGRSGENAQLTFSPPSHSQSAPPVISTRLIRYAHKHWSKFYTNHSSSHKAGDGFFKDRHWCEKEWDLAAVLDPKGEETEGREGKGAGKRVLETGCGTGAFVYP